MPRRRKKPDSAEDFLGNYRAQLEDAEPALVAAGVTAAPLWPVAVPFIDISKWQGAVNFTQMKGKGVAVVAIRLSNALTVDPLGAQYMSAAKAAGLKTIPYHFFNPEVDVVQQVTLFNKLIADNKPDGEPMVDCEWWKSGATPNPGQYTPAIRSFIAGNRTGIVYTSATFWNSFTQGVSVGPVDVICAKYPKYSDAAYTVGDRATLSNPSLWDEWAFQYSTPPVPNGFTSVAAWQFSAGYNKMGATFGCSSTDLDLNIGNKPTVDAWFGTTPTPVTEEQVYVKMGDYASAAQFDCGGGFLTWCQAGTPDWFYPNAPKAAIVTSGFIKKRVLIGPLPVGDANHTWTAADFAAHFPNADSLKGDPGPLLPGNYTINPITPPA